MLISRQKLGGFFLDFARSKSSFFLNEAFNQPSRRSRLGEVTIFLSHKHGDSELLKQAIALLQDHGASVYVDWLDTDMPTSTSAITANKIKQKIEENSRFVFLASQGAIASKWCNWELGLGDAKKFDKFIALLPITENDDRWDGAEYLQIYPYIEYSSYQTAYVVTYERRSILLKDWLRR